MIQFEDNSALCTVQIDRITEFNLGLRVFSTEKGLKEGRKHKSNDYLVKIIFTDF